MLENCPSLLPSSLPYASNTLISPNSEKGFAPFTLAPEPCKLITKSYGFTCYLNSLLLDISLKELGLSIISMCIYSLIGHSYSVGVWLGEDQRSNTIEDACFKRNRITSSNFTNYSTLNIDHNWKSLFV